MNAHKLTSLHPKVVCSHASSGNGRSLAMFSLRFSSLFHFLQKYCGWQNHSQRGLWLPAESFLEKFLQSQGSFTSLRQFWKLKFIVVALLVAIYKLWKYFLKRLKQLVSLLLGNLFQLDFWWIRDSCWGSGTRNWFNHSESWRIYWLYWKQVD